MNALTNRSLNARAMRRNEVDIAIEWAAQEGWNPGLHDAEAFHAADPEGFLVGTLADESAAVISAVRYEKHFGFVGFFIVRPELRRQGYGMQMWQAAMERLSGRTVGLDGVPAQQDNYRKSGFHLAHRNVRYQGAAAVADIRHAAPCVKLQDLPFAELAAYDRQFFPAEREAFLSSWIALPQSFALGVVEGSRLAGYGVIRACHQGHKIGPLFADTPELAQALFNGLNASVAAGSRVYLDVPANNPAAVALALGKGMQPVFETARMYKGPAPDLPLSRTYGITSFELG